MSLRVSIVVPVYNEAEGIVGFLQSLQSFREAGHQLIVVDGGSQDQSISLAEPLADHVLVSTPGRAMQMNTGAELAKGEVLLFLHADTQLPEGALELINSASTNSNWGRFDVCLSGKHPLFRVIERMMNWRSALTGIATGDQAIFIRRNIFQSLGGFPDLPLMEDIEISKRLKQYGKPARIKIPLVTSSRRWEKRGVIKTILLMWRLRLLYWLGVDAAKLARLYR